jgi:glycosyltransferase involved in cell wall biosynthesis
MRILYATDQVYLQGGAEKILTQKLNYWADVFGADVCLITSEQQGKPPFFKLSDKVKHIDLGIGYPAGTLYHPRNFGRFKAHFNRFRQEVKSFAPDAVFVISQRLFQQISPFAVGNVPVFYEYHTSHYGFAMGYKNAPSHVKLKKSVSKPLRLFVENRYTGVVFLNQTEFDYYKRRNGLIIPNFFDPSPQPDEAEKKKTVIALGRLSDHKGYDLLLESWATLEPDFPDWTLDIYGEGENRAALEAQVESLGLKSANINKATDKVPQKLAESAFYVLSSRVDNFPMVLLEALWAGIPVVSFDCPSGPRNILTENEDAFLVPPQNTTELARKMKLLMLDETLRLKMGEAGRRNVTRFSPEKVMGQWKALVEKYSKKR